MCAKQKSSTSPLAAALLAELDGEALDRLAEQLAPRLIHCFSVDKSRPASDEALLTCRQAAERANLHVETIRRAVRSGALRAGKAGRSPRIAPHDLEEWLRSDKHGRTRSQQPPRRASARRRPLSAALAGMGRQPAEYDA